MGFKEDLQRGAIGEQRVITLMKSRGHEIEDLTNNPNYYEDDIDFIIAGQTCELKTDYKISKTGNLFLESTIDYYSNGNSALGYFHKTKAEYLFYYDINNDVLYIYKMERLRKYINENKMNCKIRYIDDGYKSICGFCVNYNCVEHQTIKGVSKCA